MLLWREADELKNRWQKDLPLVSGASIVCVGAGKNVYKGRLVVCIIEELKG